MSILIKGIDLPKTKDNRWIIQIYNNGEIHIAEEIWDDTKKGHDKLRRRYIGKGEAIQIDRPHGRLIDGGRLNHIFTIAESRSNVFGEYAKPTTEEFRSAVYNAPTILEAEE